MTFEWPIDRSDLPALPALGDPPHTEYIVAATEQNAAASIAVAVMHHLSGRQFGLITRTVRPCRQPLPNHHGPGPVTSYLLSWEGDRWVNWGCGCVGGCKHGGPRQVHLPGPVYAVTEVKVGADVLTADTYKLEGNVLYRVAANWPPQDLGKPLPENGTWSVTYQVGIPVPDGVAQLTGLLAKEIIDALNNEGRCRLPRTVTTVSRQGVTYRAYDPKAIYESGKTGIPEIDLWLSSVNPNHLMAAPSVI